MIFRFSEVKCTFLFVTERDAIRQMAIEFTVTMARCQLLLLEAVKCKEIEPSRPNMTIFVHVGDSYIQPCTLLSFG